MQLVRDNTIRLFFAGDFCSKPPTSVISVSEELKSIIDSCDVRFVNFEVPLKPCGVKMPAQKRERFFQNDDAPSFLKGLGFNLFSLANNHAFDWGEEGFKKTKSALGDEAFGAGTYDDAYKVKVIEVNGVKIGFLAVCFAAYTGVFDDVSRHGGLGCAYINDLRVNHVILDAKKEVDYLFVLPHDGIEYIDVPLPETIARYRDFIDYGADGVIGTHPHCPQGWETYKGKPIFYSLGNFLFNSKEGYDYRATNRPHWYEGLCVVMTIREGAVAWEVVNTRNVDNLEIVVDKDAARNAHNERICHYLKERKEYEDSLIPHQNRLAQSDLRIIQRAFEPHDVKEAMRVLLRCLRREGNSSKEEFYYLLRNDLRRSRIVFMGKQIVNKNTKCDVF